MGISDEQPSAKPLENLVAVSRKEYYFGPKIQVPLRAMLAEPNLGNAKK